MNSYSDTEISECVLQTTHPGGKTTHPGGLRWGVVRSKRHEYGPEIHTKLSEREAYQLGKSRALSHFLSLAGECIMAVMMEQLFQEMYDDMHIVSTDARFVSSACLYGIFLLSKPDHGACKETASWKRRYRAVVWWDPLLLRLDQRLSSRSENTVLCWSCGVVV